MMTVEDIKDMLYKKAAAVFPGMQVYKDKHPTYKKNMSLKELLSMFLA